MTALTAAISGTSSVTSFEPRDPQHQVQKWGISLSPLISSPHTSIGRAESLYRSVMSTPRYVQVAPVSFVDSMVAGALCSRSGKKVSRTVHGTGLLGTTARSAQRPVTVRRSAPIHDQAANLHTQELTATKPALLAPNASCDVVASLLISKRTC